MAILRLTVNGRGGVRGPGPAVARRLHGVCGACTVLVEGMVHGSTVHGMGAALLEEFHYDAERQLLNATFMDYLKPTALDVPEIEVDRLESPSPFTTLGSKGVGGAIPGPAAGANAVEDALASFGVTIRSLPITPERVWRLINDRTT